MVQTPIKTLTLDLFLAMPETTPASEFINGQVIQKPMPQGKHSTIQSDLGAAINAVLKPNRIARAYSELRCSFGGRAIVPDLSIFQWGNIPKTAEGQVANVFSIAPDWTIEILSPDQSQSKVVRNILHCLDHGSEMGWLIDPEEKLVFVYFADRTVALFDRSNDLLPMPKFAAAMELTIEELFSWMDV